MPRAIDTYSKGYEKGRKDNLAGHVAQAVFGLLQDDPGGHFQAGYRDGAAGKKFKPPSEQESKPASTAPMVPSATDLEREWYRLCNGSRFIPQYLVDYYISALNAEGSHAAIVVGLSDFTAHTCPKCGEQGQFKIRFLGSLEHPECQWTGYMGTGAYIGFQIQQILHSGVRAGVGMKEDADKKGDKSGGIVNAIFGFLFVGVLRAALAVVLIPLHTIVALCQPEQTKADIITRVIVLGLMGAGLAIALISVRANVRTSVTPVPSAQAPTLTTQPMASDNQRALFLSRGPQAATPELSRVSITVRRLTSEPSRDTSPIWNARGDITFLSNRGSNRANGNDVWEMHPDGSAQRQIVHVEISTPPEWGDPGLGGGIEPIGDTGDFAVYEAQHFHEVMRIALSRASALPIVRIVQDGNDALFSLLLTVPGGESASNIVYSSATNQAAWVANVPGQSVQIRTSDFSTLAGQASSSHGRPLAQLPAGGGVEGIGFSPDGSALVAAMCSNNCGDGGHGPDLFVLNSRSGEVQRQLTIDGLKGVRNYAPRWAPSGEWIAFTSTNTGNESVWLVRADGVGTPMHLDTGSIRSYEPSWSKDGKRIAFTGITNGNYDVWIAEDIAPSRPSK